MIFCDVHNSISLFFFIYSSSVLIMCHAEFAEARHICHLTVKYLEKSSPAYNAQLGQCLIWPGCQQRQIWQCGEYDTRQRAVRHVMNNNLIIICNYKIIPYKMFPMNILLNYTNVKHNIIVLCYLHPPVLSCLVTSYLPDSVFSITCITLS